MTDNMEITLTKQLRQIFDLKDFLKVRGLQLSKEKSKITHIREGKKGIQGHRLYRISYVPIRYHVKIKSNANPYLSEFDKYFFQRTKWREDLAKECEQITTLML